MPFGIRIKTKKKAKISTKPTVFICVIEKLLILQIVMTSRELAL